MLTKLKDKFNALEESDDQLIQHGEARCYEICRARHPNNGFLLDGCYFGCRMTNHPNTAQPKLQETTSIDVSDTLRDIGNSFYTLADSFSVL